MLNTENNILRRGYLIPSLRFIETEQETSFLASNLEPIEGGDDPDIDW
jgi:hypothetical protein